MRSYSPYGRQGAGAPLRDETGHIIATRVGYFNVSPNTSLLPYNNLHEEEVRR